MRRVALVGPVPPWRSGIADQDERLLRALQRLGAEPVVATFSRMYPPFLYPGRADRGDESVPAGLGEVHEILDGWNPFSFVAAARFLAARGADLVLVPWWTAWWAPHTLLLLSALGAERPSAVRLLLCHNVWDHETGPLRAALTRAVLRRADRLVVQNARAEAELRAELPEKPVALLPHPSEPRVILPDREEARARLGVPSDAAVFLFAGILRRYKGWDLLLEAFRKVHREEPSALLVLAGEPWGDAERLAAEAEEAARAASRFSRQRPAFAGVRLELRYLSEEERSLWFAASDAVVCPYRHATGSGSAADALAHGRPVIGTRVDGLVDVVEEGVSGLLVPPEDAEALAEAMRRFVRERLGPRLSAGAAVRAAAFHPDVHARRLLAFGGAVP
ncbi:MAG: glycosyltransferase [Acidithiobacillales bacterium]